jgi:hypothetical protein
MSRVNEPEIEDGVFEELHAPGVALVPVTETADRALRLVVVRPNASFVTQLIATAEQLPQTRSLRRGAPADALSAYQSFENRIRDSRASTQHSPKQVA